MKSETIDYQKPNGLARFLPILDWLPSYDRSWLAADVLAGLTLWGLVVPEAMAYAGIANLPPQFGLYTLVASLFVYALFGSSRHLSVQATSASAALIASTVLAMGVTTVDMPTYQAYSVALALVVGLIFLAAGVARIGWVTQFLSKPVMDGFVTGLAVFIVVGQLNKLFGVEKGQGNVIEKLFAIIRQLPDANWVTFVFGFGTLALLFLLPRWNKKIPAGLVILFGSIIVSSIFKLNTRFGVEIVGKLPQGLPSLSLPRVPLNVLLTMIAPGIGIFLVTYSEALGVAREFAEKHGYEIDPNQELNGHAFSNIVSGLMGGMIAAGSLSASAVKETAGARTQVANLVTWVITLITLVFLTPLFTNLPEAVLAALIIHAVWHILASEKLEKIRLVSRTEFYLGLLAFLGVLFVDVLEGMLIGLVASMVYFIYQSTRPHLASLGRVPGVQGGFSDLVRHPENVPVPGVLILRLDAPIYYANALTVRDRIKMLLVAAGPSTHSIIIDSAGQDSLDITSAQMLKSLISELQGKGIAVYVAQVHAPVREFGKKTGLLDMIGEDHIFQTIDEAIHAIEIGS